MMGPLHRPLAAAASSAAAVLAATVAADLVEALMDGPGASSAGRAAAWTVPAGLVLSLLVRALWRGWRPLAPARAANDPASRASGAEARDPAAGREARARALGGLFAGALAVLLVGAAGWSGAVAAGSLTHVPRLAALTVGLFAVAGGAVAALVFARPRARPPPSRSPGSAGASGAGPARSRPRSLSSSGSRSSSAPAAPIAAAPGSRPTCRPSSSPWWRPTRPAPGSGARSVAVAPVEEAHHGHADRGGREESHAGQDGDDGSGLAAPEHEGETEQPQERKDDRKRPVAASGRRQSHLPHEVRLGGCTTVNARSRPIGQGGGAVTAMNCCHTPSQSSPPRVS